MNGWGIEFIADLSPVELDRDLLDAEPSLGLGEGFADPPRNQDFLLARREDHRLDFRDDPLAHIMKPRYV
jgi:hypothetical protein